MTHPVTLLIVCRLGKSSYTHLHEGEWISSAFEGQISYKSGHIERRTMPS